MDHPRLYSWSASVLCLALQGMSWAQSSFPDLLVSGEDECRRVLYRVRPSLSPPGTRVHAEQLVLLPQSWPTGCTSITGLGIASLFMDYGNREVLTWIKQGLQGLHFRVSPTGVPSPVMLPTNVFAQYIDQDGNYVTLKYRGVSWFGPDGTPVRSVNLTISPTIVFEDADTGGLIAYDASLASFWRVSPSGGVTRLWATVPASHYVQDLVYDPESGDYLALCAVYSRPSPSGPTHYSILRLYRDFVSWTEHGPTWGSSDLTIGRDGTLWFVGGTGLVHATWNGSVINSWQLPDLSFPGLWRTITLDQGANLLGVGSGSPGTSFHLHLSVPQESGASYVMAAALSPRPGIRTPNHRIQLQPDGLFLTSLTTPSVFEGFRGTLDANGIAEAAIHVPAIPMLQGLRVFVSFVTLRAGAPDGISTVSNLVGFTIH